MRLYTHDDAYMGPLIDPTPRPGDTAPFPAAPGPNRRLHLAAVAAVVSVAGMAIAVLVALNTPTAAPPPLVALAPSPTTEPAAAPLAVGAGSPETVKPRPVAVKVIQTNLGYKDPGSKLNTPTPTVAAVSPAPPLPASLPTASQLPSVSITPSSPLPSIHTQPSTSSTQLSMQPAEDATHE